VNFFDVLFWMGALCLLPICAVVLRDAMREGEPPREAGKVLAAQQADPGRA
jgi:hypothetical protein